VTNTSPPLRKQRRTRFDLRKRVSDARSCAVAEGKEAVFGRSEVGRVVEAVGVENWSWENEGER
jgi:hypothetical protein